MSDIETDIRREEKDGPDRHRASDPNQRIDPKYDQHNDLAAINESAQEEAMSPIQHPT